jgi:hypothetical protein
MTQPTTGKYAERIAKGAEFLDAERPDWRSSIDLDRLQLAHCERCVLGQLKLWPVLDEKRPGEEAALGFDLPAEEFGVGYSGLDVEWRQYIEATR